MYSAVLASALAGLVIVNAAGPTGALGNAAIVQGNPVGVTYTATLPNVSRSDIRGFVAGTSNANGTGVFFNINLSGLPDASLGPFCELLCLVCRTQRKTNHRVTSVYHIHDQPVPADGNCTKTLAHQDPYIRGEKPPCDPTQPETCQVGDLAGKHGKITTNPFQTA